MIGGGNHLKSYFYEDRFNLFGDHGINLVRVWIQCDGNDGAWAMAFERNDQIGTWIDQENAYRFDKILESAEENDIALILCSVGNVNDAWDTTDWNDDSYLDFWKRNFRYRVARWGYC